MSHALLPYWSGLCGYMPRCVFKSSTHKDGWKLNYWRKASDGRGGGGTGGGYSGIRSTGIVQSTLILSCCRIFWGLKFSIPGVFLGRKFGTFFWFLYLRWNVFEDCCSHTATTTFNFLFFFFFRVISFNSLREILQAWIFGSGELVFEAG